MSDIDGDDEVSISWMVEGNFYVCPFVIVSHLKCTCFFMFQFQDAQESPPQYVYIHILFYVIFLLAFCLTDWMHSLLQARFHGPGHSDNGGKKGYSLFFQQWFRSGQEDYGAMGGKQHVPLSRDQRLRVSRSNTHVWTCTDYLLFFSSVQLVEVHFYLRAPESDWLIRNPCH